MDSIFLLEQSSVSSPVLRILVQSTLLVSVEKNPQPAVRALRAGRAGRGPRARRARGNLNFWPPRPPTPAGNLNFWPPRPPRPREISIFLPPRPREISLFGPRARRVRGRAGVPCGQLTFYTVFIQQLNPIISRLKQVPDGNSSQIYQL